MVVHAARHARSLTELSDRELETVAEAWRRRAGVASAQGAAYVHAFVNEGRGAGASLAHSHSQLVGLDREPAGTHADTPVLVDERDGLRLVCPERSRVPFELRVDGADGFGARLGAALALAAEGLRRVRALEGAVPANLWLHGSHLTVFPRLAIPAGIELGAGVWVNPLPPEEAAAQLGS